MGALLIRGKEMKLGEFVEMAHKVIIVDRLFKNVEGEVKEGSIKVYVIPNQSYETEKGEVLRIDIKL